MLEERGFAVVEACHADQAWEILETRPDIEVLFTDIDMLGSMCVLILAQRVFACWPDIHLVLTSGRHRLSDDEIPDHGLFVPKPYGASEVVKAIHSAC